MLSVHLRAMSYRSHPWLQGPFCSIYLSEHHFWPHSIIASIGGPYFEKRQLSLNFETWRFSSFCGIQSNHWTKKITRWKVTQAVSWEIVTFHWMNGPIIKKRSCMGNRENFSPVNGFDVLFLCFRHRVTLYRFLCPPPLSFLNLETIFFKGEGL
jgi:hypothetical protein